MTAEHPAAPDDILISYGSQGSWAWTGVRLEPAPTAAEHGGFAGLPEEQRRAEAVSREQVWLAEQGQPRGGHRIELRYVNDPVTRRVSCTLLGQVHAPDPAGAAAAARALRTRLRAAPRHVRAGELDAAGVRSALMPFGPDAAQQGPVHPADPEHLPEPTVLPGVAEVRKGLSWAWSTRYDARFRVGVLVHPLAGGAVSWEPVWDALARQEHRTMVGVCLEPYEVGEGLRSRLAYLAQEYGRLAAPGTPNPVYQQPVPPDPFAVRAAPAYHDAAHRYTGHAFRLRVAVAADGPVPVHLAEVVASTLSDAGAAGRTGGPVTAVPGSGVGGRAAVCVPRGDEAATAWRNVTAINRSWLEETYRQGVPEGHMGQVERILGDLVDLPEATAAFRFPYEIPGRPPLFATETRWEARREADVPGAGGRRGGAADPHFPDLPGTGGLR
ncbi:hypothetical protein [Streptomyces sp. NPDC047108]|uniref:hypothetical protein n=1 Tax=Streptomyces sp. NPDC047108 TaxID=3155025 RepID=UPI0033F665A1